MDASWEADVIIPAVPYGTEKEVVEKIRNVATQKIVISIANPLTETYDGLVTAPGTSACTPHNHHRKTDSRAYAP